jgi:hypothetical protein
MMLDPAVLKALHCLKEQRTDDQVTQDHTPEQKIFIHTHVKISKLAL